MKARTVRVEASARLHLGFYNIIRDGMAYGSLGVAIDRPLVLVEAAPSASVDVTVGGSEPHVEGLVRDVLSRLGARGVHVKIANYIPRHVGLGSTTQIALGVATAVSKLLGFDYTVRELAVLLGRGRDSGVGIAAFEGGGFVVDSGRSVREGFVKPPESVDDLPQVILRRPLPGSWCFVVVVPEGVRGLDEKEERRALDVPECMSSELEYELYKTVLTSLLPSIARLDIETFGRSITKIQRLVGQYFAKYQAGTFCCEETEFLVNALLECGALGAGQSSWGPTAYGIVEGSRAAKRVLERVLRLADRKGLKVSAFVARTRNRGARIEVSW